MHSLIAFTTRITPESWGLATYVVAAFGLVGFMLGSSYVLAGRNHGRAKDEPFESGAVSAGGAFLGVVRRATAVLNESTARVARRRLRSNGRDRLRWRLHS